MRHGPGADILNLTPSRDLGQLGCLGEAVSPSLCARWSQLVWAVSVLGRLKGEVENLWRETEGQGKTQPASQSPSCRQGPCSLWLGMWVAERRQLKEQRGCG